MGEGPGRVIGYAQSHPWGPALQRRSVPLGVLAAVAGTVAFAVALLFTNNPIPGAGGLDFLAIPLFGAGLFGLLAAPLFGLWAVVYVVYGIRQDGNVERAGIAALVLVGLALAGCGGAILVLLGV